MENVRVLPIQTAGQVLELQLAVEVTSALLGAEAPPGRLRGVPQRGRDTQLRDEARAEVDVAQGHDGLVHVRVNGQLEAFSSLGGKCVIVNLKQFTYL
jgi:hypothetical protein